MESKLAILQRSSIFPCVICLINEKGFSGMQELVRLISLTSLESASNIFPSIIKLQVW